MGQKVQGTHCREALGVGVEGHCPGPSAPQPEGACGFFPLSTAKLKCPQRSLAKPFGKEKDQGNMKADSALVTGEAGAWPQVCQVGWPHAGLTRGCGVWKVAQVGSKRQRVVCTVGVRPEWAGEQVGCCHVWLQPKPLPASA